MPCSYGQNPQTYVGVFRRKNNPGFWLNCTGGYYGDARQQLEKDGRIYCGILLGVRKVCNRGLYQDAEVARLLHQHPLKLMVENSVSVQDTPGFIPAWLKGIADTDAQLSPEPWHKPY